MTRSRLRSLSAHLIGVLVLLAISRAALGATGMVGGTVVDDKGPIPGAVVSLTGGPLTSARGAMSDPKGEYHFADVPVGDQYVVSVTFAGGLPIRSAPFSVREKGLTKVPPISIFV